MKIAISRKTAWEKTPPALKRVLGTVLQTIPPAYLLGSAFRRRRAWLEQAQGWSTEQARDYQLSQVRRICDLAYTTSYYKRVFDAAGVHPRDITSLDAIRRLPFLDRKTVQENLDEMCTVDVAKSNLDYVTTGGTTGFPLRFYMSPERHAVEYAHLTGGWERIGYRLGQTMVVLRGRTVPMDPKLGFHHEYDPLLRHHYYSNFHMDPHSVAQYVEHLRTLGPVYLHAYPSAAYNLARFIRSTGTKPVTNVRGILLESENVYPEQRAYMSECFRCPVFSSYGHTEKLIAAAECESSSHYHVWPTYGFFELVDENGGPVTTPGQRGEMVGTGFINSVVPFIRYRTGDFATYVGDQCPACGRHHVVLSDVRGHRRQESLALSDGTLMTWTALMASIHDDTFDGVERFQFVQHEVGKSIMRFVAGPNFTPSDEARIQSNLNRKFEGRLLLTLERVDNIPLTKSGKMVYVDQRIAELAVAHSA